MVWGKDTGASRRFSLQANKLKVQGNEALSHSNYWAAVQCYTQALELDPDNAALYSNRSVAYARHNKFAEALDDAEKAIELNPTWAKVSCKLPHKYKLKCTFLCL